MNSIKTIKTVTMCAALALVLFATEVHAADGSFERSLTVDEPIFLDVSTGSGSVKITTGGTGKIEVVGHIRVGRRFFTRSSDEAQEIIDRIESNPPVTLEDGRLEVGHIKHSFFGSKVSISYEIVVPADTEVKSHTGSGSQKISDVAGPVEASTGSGKITLTNIGGSVKASTGSGGIRANDIAGAFEAHTGSGSIRLTQVAPGDVVVTTGSGSSELHGVVGALSVKAGSGRVVVDGEQKGTWTIDTGSGSVKITLPDDAAFNLDAESSSGGIDIDHPITVHGKISRKRVRGEVRGGGDLLQIETGSGGIRIE